MVCASLRLFRYLSCFLPASLYALARISVCFTRRLPGRLEISLYRPPYGAPFFFFSFGSRDSLETHREELAQVGIIETVSPLCILPHQMNTKRPSNDDMARCTPFPVPEQTATSHGSTSPRISLGFLLRHLMCIGYTRPSERTYGRPLISDW